MTKPNIDRYNSTESRANTSERRALGEGAFAAEETFPYPEAKNLFGQNREDSCVAACCRMLLKDRGRDVPEYLLRTAANVRPGEGASERDAEAGLRAFQVAASFKDKLSFEQLQAATSEDPALVFVRTSFTNGLHAIIVDGFEGDRVKIRDPLPPGLGSAYRLAVITFIEAWNTNAVILNPP